MWADHERGRGLTAAALVLGVLLVAALVLPRPAPAAVLKAEAVLPPGQSGYVSIPGVASGTGSPHLTDQTSLFSNFELRPVRLRPAGDLDGDSGARGNDRA